MTTISNPGASQTVAYNLSGTTVVSVTGALAANPPNAWTVIPAASGHTVAILSCPTVGNPPNTENVFQLPTGMNVGDAIEMCQASSSGVPPTTAIIQAGSGETVINVNYQNYFGGVATIEMNYYAIVRKVSSTEWAVLSLS